MADRHDPSRYVEHFSTITALESPLYSSPSTAIGAEPGLLALADAMIEQLGA